TESNTKMKLTACEKITLGTLMPVISAVIIELIVYFVTYEKTPFYHHISLKVNNIDYDSKFEKMDSQEYMELNHRVPSHLIHETFHGSQLRRQYVKSHVVQIIQAQGKVIIHAVLKFKSCFKNTAGKFQDRIETILYQKLKGKTGSLWVDSSSFKFSGCGQGTITPSGNKIAGMDAQEGEWPWQASLQQNGVHRWGATLISNSGLFTPAHRFIKNNNEKEWNVSFGLLLSDPQTQQSIKDIIIHEKYHYPTRDNDIAVVHLPSPVLHTSNILRACLPEATHTFPPKSDVVVTGWGTLKSDRTSPNILQKGLVKIINNKTCNSEEVYGHVIIPGMLRVGFLKGSVDACQGDSSGPLKGTWVFAGTVKTLPNKPGVYTRVTHYRDWILSKTGL
uniref:Transmembrane protease serine n=1 Tax=Mustela putorius furo TaxID=9669 RepID=M3XRD3_MUSPF